MSSLYSLNSRFATLEQRVEMLKHETQRLFEEIVSEGEIKFVDIDFSKPCKSEIEKLKESGEFFNLPCITILDFERGNEHYVLEIDKEGRFTSIDKKDNFLIEHDFFNIMYEAEKRDLIKNILDFKNNKN